MSNVEIRVAKAIIANEGLIDQSASVIWAPGDAVAYAATRHGALLAYHPSAKKVDIVASPQALAATYAVKRIRGILAILESHGVSCSNAHVLAEHKATATQETDDVARRRAERKKRTATRRALKKEKEELSELAKRLALRIPSCQATMEKYAKREYTFPDEQERDVQVFATMLRDHKANYARALARLKEIETLLPLYADKQPSSDYSDLL